MRITGGKWGGRKLLVPDSDQVRPTQDRVREALFSMLVEVIPGASVLDLYAGSGAFGLDALSHGATAAKWVELDKKCFATLQKNLSTFGWTSEDAVHSDVVKWLDKAPVEQFDVIFADPPYRLAREHGFAALSEQLITRGFLGVGGVLVLEMDDDTHAEELPGLICLKDRLYGHTRIAVYQRMQD